MFDNFSAETATLIAALVAATSSILGSVMTSVYGRRDTRREWARSSLAEVYTDVIESAHKIEAVLHDLVGMEIDADERDPDGAPHYSWTEDHQAAMSDAYKTVVRARARIDMFAPRAVVRATQQLELDLGMAEDYYRLAHEVEIMEQEQAEPRLMRAAASRAKFTDAVRRDLGVARTPRLHRTLHRWKVISHSNRLARRRRKRLAKTAAHTTQ